MQHLPSESIHFSTNHTQQDTLVRDQFHKHMSMYLRHGIPSACSIYPQNLSISAQITPNKTPWYGTNSTNTCQCICVTEYLALAAFTLRIYPFQHKSHPTRHLGTGPIPQTHVHLPSESIHFSTNHTQQDTLVRDQFHKHMSIYLRHGIPSACSIYPQNLSISAQITPNKTLWYGTNSTNTYQIIMCHGIPSACSIYPQHLSISAQITPNKTPWYGTNSINTCQVMPFLST